MSGKAIRNIRTAKRFKRQKPQSLRSESPFGETIVEITRCGFLPEGIIAEAHIEECAGQETRTTAGPEAAAILRLGCGIEGQLIVGLIGAFDGDVVHEQSGTKNRGGHIAIRVGSVEILARSFNAGAEGALIEVVEDSAADQFTLAVRADAVEQARGVGAAESFDVIDALETTVFCQIDELVEEFVVAEAIFGRDLENGDGGAGSASDSGATVAVRLGKVADGLAANEVVLQLAVINEIDGLGGHTFVIDVVGANEGFAIESFQEWIVDDLYLLGEDARVEA
jgi:hypothetical protein